MDLHFQSIANSLEAYGLPHNVRLKYVLRCPVCASVIDWEAWSETLERICTDAGNYYVNVYCQECEQKFSIGVTKKFIARGKVIC